MKSDSKITALRFVLVFIIGLFFGCADKQGIGTEKYKEALLKIHQCEAYHELKMASNNPSFLKNCKAQALKELNISKEDFDEITQYYKSKPKEFEALYDSLLLKYP